MSEERFDRLEDVCKVGEWVKKLTRGNPTSVSRKNGHKAGKQNHICVDCGMQFIDSYGLSCESLTLLML